MIQKIEDFIFNKLAGKLLARAAVTLASYLASGAIGAKVSIDPSELTAFLIAGGHALYECIKTWRIGKTPIQLQPPS